MNECKHHLPTPRGVCVNCQLKPVLSKEVELGIQLYLGARPYDAIDFTRLLVVRLWDGMDGEWCDVTDGPVDAAEALRVWNLKTDRGTKNIHFNNIDYYRIFEADTQMVYSGTNEMFR